MQIVDLSKSFLKEYITLSVQYVFYASNEKCFQDLINVTEQKMPSLLFIRCTNGITKSRSKLKKRR